MQATVWGSMVMVAVGVALAGCAGVAVEGASIARDKAEVEMNMSAAEAGNAEAQYKVGKSLCCALDNDGPSFYNTQQSVSWLCRSAAQSYAPAALKLGEIYSGDIVSGPRMMRRVAAKVADPRTNLPVSYAWYQRAASLGEADAGKSAAELWPRMNPTQQAEATALVKGQSPLACEWAQVIGPS
jgi:TPR repeat protein